MATDSFTEELDFEDDTQNESQNDDEFYCAICSDCYDEAKEFIDHINSPDHVTLCDEKLSLLQEGDNYCSICLVKAEPNFEDHCSNSDHCQFFDSMRRSTLETPSPSLKVVEVSLPPTTSDVQPLPVNKQPSKTTPLRKKDNAIKMIGLNYIKRKDNEWFCNICLEKFKSVETHCSKAMHAIQCIKLCDPDLAYEIKVSATQKGKKKIVSSIISSKVEEIYEKEKNTPEYIKTMMDLEGVKQTDAVVIDCEEDLGQDGSPSVNASNEEEDKSIIQPEITKEEPGPVDQIDDTSTPSNSQDIGEMVSLFEEEDRSFIPMNDEITENDSKSLEGVKSEENNRAPSKEATMIVGVTYLKLKGRSYYCGLCDIMCKSSLESCKLHITSSLHRRRMINKFSSHPIPNYLEKLRTRDAALYNKLIRSETMKIEVEERKTESSDDQLKRAGILGIKKVELLPEPLLNVWETPSCDKSLNLMELAKKWDMENNANMFQKPAREAPVTGSNKSTISPIQPQIENILVGVKTVTHVKNTNFHCGLCNIKFDVKNKRNEKHHVNGRLHKKKALVAAYGQDVDVYLQHRSKKDGYDALNKIINQACVPLEKEEVETELPSSREIRARLLGVKVEQLPLPMIIMFSNTEAFDIKMAISEWKGGKKNSGISSKAEGPTVSSVVKQSNKDNKPKATVSVTKSKPVVASDQGILKSHIDPPALDQKEVPSQLPTETGKSPGARNIFDLCKPMADVSPDTPVFKTPNSSTLIKNIDIDGLRKSLVDAELGEFVPVAKSIPEKDAASKNKRKPSAEEQTPKSSMTAEERKRRKSGDNVSIEKRPAENIKSDINEITQKQSDTLISKVSSNTPIVKQARNGARRTYDQVIKVKSSYQSAKTTIIRAKPQAQQANASSSDRQNHIPPQSSQSNPGSSRPHQQGSTWNGPPSKGDHRNQARGNSSNRARGNSSNNQFSLNERNNNAVRDNSADRSSNNLGRNNNFSNNRGRGNNSRPQSQAGAIPNTEYSNRGNSGNRGNSRENYSPHKNQSDPGSRLAKTFDIDVGSMRNTNLSSALAKVTNITPISQACSAKINEAAQNIRSNSQSINYAITNGFQNNPTQGGPNMTQQNFHGNQFQGDNTRQSSNQGFGNQGFGQGSNQSNNFVNQGHSHNQAGGFGNSNGASQQTNWNNNNNNNNQYGGFGGNQGGGNNNYGGNRGGGNNDFGRGNGSGRGHFNQSNVVTGPDRRNDFQNNNPGGGINFANNRGGFNNSGKRSNNTVQDSFGYDDRQKRQRNDHFNR